MKRKLFALIVALAGAAMTATAENYGLTVGGVDVTDKNCSNITGENIKALDESKAFSAVYNPTTKTLTLKNVKISREGSNRRAVQNDNVDGLTIVLDGDNYLSSRDASAVRLNKSGTIKTAPNTEEQKYCVIHSDDQEAIYVTNGATLTISDAILYIYANKKSAIGGDSGKESMAVSNSGVRITAGTTSSTNNHCVENMASFTVENAALNLMSGKAVLGKVKAFSTTGNAAILQSVGKYVYYSSSQQSMVSTDGTVVKSMSIAPVVRINEANFPDKAFREYLYSQSYGKDSVLIVDNPLTVRRGQAGVTYKYRYMISELPDITVIDVSEKGIASLKGIEYLTELTRLYCNGNELTALDLTAQKSLQEAYLTSNRLARLTLPQGTALITLHCDNNQLTALDVSGCTGLANLYCDNNKLTALDLSKNSGLAYAMCNYNSLTSLLPPSGQVLNSLYCHDNQLTQLDCSGCTGMAYLNCDDNRLQTLRLPESGELGMLRCSNNALTTLDLAKNSKIIALYCSNNNLSALDLTFQRIVSVIECYGNKIKGEAATNFINSLVPTDEDTNIKFVDHSLASESNECTAEQVAQAKKRGYILQHYNTIWSDATECLYYDLWLGGKHIGNHNTSLYKKYLYSPEDKTLSLLGDISGTGTARDAATGYGAALYSEIDGLTISVDGDATLSGADDDCIGLLLRGKTLIEGDGNLAATGYSGIYMYASDTLTISGNVEVEAEGKYHGIVGWRVGAAKNRVPVATLEIKDKATVRAKGGAGAICDWAEIILSKKHVIAVPEGATVVGNQYISIGTEAVSGDTWVEINYLARHRRGDVDENEEINTADVVAVYNYIIGGEESGIVRAYADVDGDGEVNTSDVVAVYNIIINGEEPEPDFTDQTFAVGDVEFTMVAVEGGTFQMGASADGDDVTPVHYVSLGNYHIGQTEVTQALWTAVMGSNPSHFEGDDLPVEQVSWEDCQAFIAKLNELTGQTFRLPTEAEWEFAAKGGNKSRGYTYSGSKDIGEVAWYGNNSASKTRPVGTKAANELGLYDMSGNVWEWCQDWYADYDSTAQSNPTGPDSGTGRVFRGGGWNQTPSSCRPVYRFNSIPDSSYTFLGLRLAL